MLSLSAMCLLAPTAEDAFRLATTEEYFLRAMLGRVGWLNDSIRKMLKWISVLAFIPTHGAGETVR